jgi:uncharacterized membrane-anchored protein YjiN (DUF445 family)
MPNPIDRLARQSLLLALLMAMLGVLLRDSHVAPFWGGLLLAFGEAALVGGLADWFAVRALFVHPFGLPFPHTAIIPRNRLRIVREIRSLVLTEWLPRPLLIGKIQGYDFVDQALVSLLKGLEPQLREGLRTVARDGLAVIDLHPLAGPLARGLASAADNQRVRAFLAEIITRAREGNWLEPLMRALVVRLEQWADLPASQAAIRERLERAADTYQDRGWFKSLTFQFAQVFGGIDLDEATTLLQREIKQFANEQLSEAGQLRQVVRDGLGEVERRLREDPDYLADLSQYVVAISQEDALAGLLGPVLETLRLQALRSLESPTSPLLVPVFDILHRLTERVGDDASLRDTVNGWCRRLAITLVERHHDVIGTLVEEQLSRLSDERLTALLEARVGEDLNWIRLNGTFVGGLIGVVLYLLFALLGLLVRP